MLLLAGFEEPSEAMGMADILAAEYCFNSPPSSF
jgi:hypothetical protein